MMKMLRSAAVLSALVGVLGVPAVAWAQNQNDSVLAVWQSQAVLMRRIFSELESAPPAKQRFDLWMADLLLTPGQGPLGSAGLEEVAAANALTVLQRLERSADAEIAALATTVRNRIAAELDLSNIAASTALAVEAGKPVSLASGEYDGWLTIPARARMEYVIQVTGCRMLRAVVVGADRQQVVAGASSLDGRLSFVSAADGNAYVRLRTPLCESSRSVSVSARQPTTRLTAAPTRAAAVSVSPGITYSGSVGSGTEQWLSLPVRAGQRYVLLARPNGGVDPMLTLYEPNGSTEIDSDDDSGGSRAAKIDFVRNADATLLVKVHAYSGAGDFDLSVTAQEPPARQAVDFTVGSTRDGEVTAERPEQWWRVSVQPGRRYIFETTPADSFDTVITVFDANGATELDSDDDGGEGLGSRLRIIPDAMTTTLLLKVSGIDLSPGRYRLAITMGPALSPMAAATTSATAVAVTAGTSYQGSLKAGDEQWLRMEAQAGRIYTLETSPDGNLDTVITAFEADGTTEIASDDDGGTGFGSKLEIPNGARRTLLVRIAGLSDSSGTFELAVTEALPPLQSAKPLTLGTAVSGTLSAAAGEEWWVLNNAPVGMYVFEAAVQGELDTIVTLYGPDGVVELKSNDDAGGALGLGSRLEFFNDAARTLVLKVGRLGSTTGTYQLRVTAPGR